MRFELTTSTLAISILHVNKDPRLHNSLFISLAYDIDGSKDEGAFPPAGCLTGNIWHPIWQHSHTDRTMRPTSLKFF